MPFVPTRPNTCPGRGVGNLPPRQPRSASSHNNGGVEWRRGGEHLQAWPLAHRHLCSLNAFAPYRCVVSFAMFFGRLMIMIASKGHFCGSQGELVVQQRRTNSSRGGRRRFQRPIPGKWSRARQQRTLTQMPQPMHSSSEIQAILEFGVTSMHSLPV